METTMDEARPGVVGLEFGDVVLGAGPVTMRPLVLTLQLKSSPCPASYTRLSFRSLTCWSCSPQGYASLDARRQYAHPEEKRLVGSQNIYAR